MVLVDVVEEAETRTVSRMRAKAVFQSTYGHPSYLSNYQQSLWGSYPEKVSRRHDCPHLE